MNETRTRAIRRRETRLHEKKRIELFNAKLSGSMAAFSVIDGRSADYDDFKNSLKSKVKDGTYMVFRKGQVKHSHPEYKRASWKREQFDA